MSLARRRELLAHETRVTGPPYGHGRLRVGLLYPSGYSVAMASLALHAIYRLLNDLPQVSCERLFFPPPVEPTDRLVSLETGTPLSEFDVVAISSSYELDWLRLAAALRCGGVEPLAAARDDRDPLVLVGGPAVTANPQPLSHIADAFFLGEVEDHLAGLIDVLLGAGSRAEVLESLAQQPSVYVPAVPRDRPIPRASVANLDDWPTHTEILTPHCEFANVFLVEVGRGCPRSCRFCLARCIYAPVRFRSLAALQDTVALGLRYTDRIGLVGAAVADHPHLQELMTWIVERGGSVSTSSLRIERVTAELLQPLARSGQQTITLAPEVADEGLARVLGKPITREALHRALAATAAVGLRGAKLYFMVGVPGETDAQALEIADLVGELERAFPSLSLSASISPLVPKPHTPLARVAVPAPGEVQVRLAAVQRALRSHTRRVEVKIASARWAAVQTVLSRGGPEVTPVLLEGGEMGAGEVLRTMSEHGLQLEHYLKEQTDPVPWEVVDPRPPSEATDGS